MLDSLYSEHFQIQRQRLDAALATSGFESVAIFAGAPHVQFLDDIAYPFKANPHFKLWIPEPDVAGSWILYRPSRKPVLVFLQPADYWHKPPADPSGYWTSHFEIEVVREAHEAHRFLRDLPRCAFIGEWDEEFAGYGFADRNPASLLTPLHYARAIKTAYEIECMRRASLRAARGHRAAEAAFRQGASEFQIYLAYLQGSEQAETELPYHSIIGLNENAAVLHYQHLERVLPDSRHSFLIDAGATFAGYASDITRTYSYADDEFAALIEQMHKLQLRLCAMVRPGVDYVEIHRSAHLAIAQLLRETGFISVSADEAVTSGLSSVFFPHGVGHLLGLQVHDVAGFTIDAQGTQKSSSPEHPFLRLTRTLEPGFVVTIEPGIYFIDMLLATARESAHARAINWNQVERFKRCGGIRIEDDVVCTAGEPENLTRDAFESTLSVTGVAALA
jgi:Xaa-Pro dipeptidase (EC:3.4.13.9). Metallo peptidase. MEROPS family M24B